MPNISAKIEASRIKDEASYKAMRDLFEKEHGFVMTVTPEDGIDIPPHLEHMKGHCFKTGTTKEEFANLKKELAMYCKWFELEDEPSAPIWNENDARRLAAGKPAAADAESEATPDFVSLQTHLADPPSGLGANRLHATNIPGSRGEKVKVFVIENGVHEEHEDRPKNFMGTAFGAAFSSLDHGTSVYGLIGGNDENGFGIKGIAPNVQFYSIANSAGLTRSLVEILKLSDPVLDTVFVGIELQYAPMPEFGVPYQYVPPTQFSSVRDIIRLLTEKGVHVFIAAANGGADLDDPRFGGVFHEDVGAVMVGAGSRDAHNPLPFSGYGDPVHVCGQGYWVVTTGYGGLWNGGYPNRTYTDGFNGTSSSLPMPLACGAIAMAMLIAQNKHTLTPRELRQLLIETGTPQAQSNKHIGPFPNLLKLKHRLVPGPDYDLDGVVKFNDFIQFAAYYQASDRAADLNGDGLIDFDDFLVFARSFNGPAKWAVMQAAKFAIKRIDAQKNIA